MTSLEWIHLYEAFEAFETLAVKSNFRVDDVKAMGDELFELCPIPQPTPR